jgi:tight adherence protein B
VKSAGFFDSNSYILIAAWGIAATSIIYISIYHFNRWYISYEEQFVQRTEQDLYGMFSSVSPQKILRASFACFAIVFTLVLFFVGHFSSTLATTLSLTFAALLGLGASFIPRLLIKRAAAIRIQKFDLQLLDALLSMSNALKAGFSINQTFEALVEEKRDPISQEFDLLLREIRLGVKFEVAAENLLKRVPSEDLQIVLAGIETARQTGGNLTEVFDRLAVVIRERMRVQGRIESLTAQGRLQGWAVGLMPFFLAIGFYYIQPALMMGFIQSVGGIFLILVMLFFQGIGVFFIRKIVNIDV